MYVLTEILLYRYACMHVYVFMYMRVYICICKGMFMCIYVCINQMFDVKIRCLIICMY